jgi:hypothetical protein
MMKCETNAQLHDALAALIEGSSGTMREALQAIKEFTDEKYTHDEIINMSFEERNAIIGKYETEDCRVCKYGKKWDGIEGWGDGSCPGCKKWREMA